MYILFGRLFIWYILFYGYYRQEIKEGKEMKILKRISKKEATEKYGVITSGVNSLYQYFLTVDGYIIDSDGDIRYIPSKTEA